MHDYSSGGYDDEIDGCDGTQSPGSGKVSPNDPNGHHDETDRHDSMQSLDGEFSVTCVAI